MITSTNDKFQEMWSTIRKLDYCRYDRDTHLPLVNRHSMLEEVKVNLNIFWKKKKSSSTLIWKGKLHSYGWSIPFENINKKFVFALQLRLPHFMFVIKLKFDLIYHITFQGPLQNTIFTTSIKILAI